MAHWIVTDHGNYMTYRCSQCGSEWRDDDPHSRDISTWPRCLVCGGLIDRIANKYFSDLVHRPEVKKEEKSESKELAELGEYVAKGFAAGLQSSGIVMMSRKEYDTIVEDFDTCIKERDRELFRVDKEMRELKEERDGYIDILKQLGIHYHIGKIIKNSLQVDEFDNPHDRTKMVKVTFKVEG